MPEFEVRPVEKHEFDTWDDFVLNSPQGAFYHTSAWKRIIDSAYHSAELRLLGCFDSHGLVGGCVALTRPRFGHQTAVTPLATPYVGFVLQAPLGEKISDKVSRQSQILEAISGAMCREFDYQSLVNAPHLQDVRPLQQAGYRLSPRFTYHLNLKLPAEELWTRLDGSVRRQVLKAEKADSIELSDLFDSGEAYSIFSSVFERRNERCPVSHKLFTQIATHDELKDCREILCVHEAGRLVSFIVLLKFARTIYYALAGTAPDRLASGVSSFLVWEVIKSHANSEWDVLDFIGANVPSISRFKEGFNPVLVTHFHADYFGAGYLRFGKAISNVFKR